MFSLRLLKTNPSGSKKFCIAARNGEIHHPTRHSRNQTDPNAQSWSPCAGRASVIASVGHATRSIPRLHNFTYFMTLFCMQITLADHRLPLVAFESRGRNAYRPTRISSNKSQQDQNEQAPRAWRSVLISCLEHRPTNGRTNGSRSLAAKNVQQCERLILVKEQSWCNRCSGYRNAATLFTILLQLFCSNGS